MASKRKLEALESGIDAVYQETQLIQIDNINPISSQPNKLPSGYSGKLPATNPILPLIINPPVTPPVSVKSTTTASITPISSGSTPIKAPSSVKGTTASASKSVTTKSSASSNLSGLGLLKYLHALLPTNNTPINVPNSGFQIQNGLLVYNGQPYNGVYQGFTYNNGQLEIATTIIGTSSILSVNQSENTPILTSIPKGDI